MRKCILYFGNACNYIIKSDFIVLKANMLNVSTTMKAVRNKDSFVCSSGSKLHLHNNLWEKQKSKILFVA